MFVFFTMARFGEPTIFSICHNGYFFRWPQQLDVPAVVKALDLNINDGNPSICEKTLSCIGTKRRTNRLRISAASTTRLSEIVTPLF
jgi:hypothetical protein